MAAQARLDTKALAAVVLRMTRDLSMRAAAELIGVSHGTVSRWRKLQDRGEPIDMDPATEQAARAFLERASDLTQPDRTRDVREALERMEEVMRLLRTLLPPDAASRTMRRPSTVKEAQASMSRLKQAARENPAPSRRRPKAG